MLLKLEALVVGVLPKLGVGVVLRDVMLNVLLCLIAVEGRSRLMGWSLLFAA